MHLPNRGLNYTFAKYPNLAHFTQIHEATMHLKTQQANCHKGYAMMFAVVKTVVDHL